MDQPPPFLLMPIDQHRVCIVDDDDAVRDGLALLLETAGFAVKAYDSAEAFLAVCAPQGCGCCCLVLDEQMPGMNGSELQAVLARRGVSLPIIFLSAHGDIPTAVQAIKAGALDFLTKPVDGEVLIERVRAALSQYGENTQREAAHQALCDRVASLTEREREVMRLAVAGQVNKAIAQQLGISHRTVEIHRARVMQKTGVANLVELVRLAASCKHVLEPVTEPREP